jgi:hypothetical protein
MHALTTVSVVIFSGASLAAGAPRTTTFAPSASEFAGTTRTAALRQVSAFSNATHAGRIHCSI